MGHCEFMGLSILPKVSVCVAASISSYVGGSLVVALLSFLVWLFEASLLVNCMFVLLRGVTFCLRDLRLRGRGSNM